MSLEFWGNLARTYNKAEDIARARKAAEEAARLREEDRIYQQKLRDAQLEELNRQKQQREAQDIYSMNVLNDLRMGRIQPNAQLEAIRSTWESPVSGTGETLYNSDKRFQSLVNSAMMPTKVDESIIPRNELSGLGERLGITIPYGTKYKDIWGMQTQLNREQRAAEERKRKEAETIRKQEEARRDEEEKARRAALTEEEKIKEDAEAARKLFSNNNYPKEKIPVILKNNLSDPDKFLSAFKKLDQKKRNALFAVVEMAAGKPISPESWNALIEHNPALGKVFGNRPPTAKALQEYETLLKASESIRDILEGEQVITPELYDVITSNHPEASKFIRVGMDVNEAKELLDITDSESTSIQKTPKGIATIPLNAQRLRNMLDKYNEAKRKMNDYIPFNELMSEDEFNDLESEINKARKKLEDEIAVGIRLNNKDKITLDILNKYKDEGLIPEDKYNIFVNELNELSSGNTPAFQAVIPLNDKEISRVRSLIDRYPYDNAMDILNAYSKEFPGVQLSDAVKTRLIYGLNQELGR